MLGACSYLIFFDVFIKYDTKIKPVFFILSRVYLTEKILWLIIKTYNIMEECDFV